MKTEFCLLCPHGSGEGPEEDGGTQRPKQGGGDHDRHGREKSRGGHDNWITDNWIGEEFSGPDDLLATPGKAGFPPGAAGWRLG